MPSSRRHLLASFSAALLALPLASCNSAAPTPAPPLKVIGFISDFDVKDDAIGICKAVMDGIAPGVRIIDITH